MCELTQCLIAYTIIELYTFNELIPKVARDKGRGLFLRAGIGAGASRIP